MSFGVSPVLINKSKKRLLILIKREPVAMRWAVVLLKPISFDNLEALKPILLKAFDAIYHCRIVYTMFPCLKHHVKRNVSKIGASCGHLDVKKNNDEK